MAALTPRRAPTALPIPEVGAAARFTRADYAHAAHALMPRGRAWSDDADSVQQRLLAALSIVFERSDAAAIALLGGTVPGSLSALLPEWEASVGLPAGIAPTIQSRLAQVRLRFAASGSMSRRHFIDFAAALGFTIEIETYRAGMPGPASLGLARDAAAWIYVWGVRVVTRPASLTPSDLLRELTAIKPAETTVVLIN